VQDQPDESALSMGDGSDGLIVSWVRDRAAIDALESGDCSLRLQSPLLFARAGTDPPGEAFLGGKGRCGRADFGNDLLR
jgi:hypothetical protein